MPEQLTRFFHHLTGALFLISATVLFVCAGTNTALPQPHDPVLLLPIRAFFWITGGICLAAAMVNVSYKITSLQAVALAWVVSIFTLYRLYYLCHGGLSLSGYLVNFSAAFNVAPQTANVITELTLAALFCGCYGTLIGVWKPAKNAMSRLKTFCSACGGHISFKVPDAGKKIPCPHCQTTVVLRSSEETLKMPCYFCGGHIEFPPHAAGEKLKCPHCQMDITLKEPAAA